MLYRVISSREMVSVSVDSTTVSYFFVRGTPFSPADFSETAENIELSFKKKSDLSAKKV